MVGVLASQNGAAAVTGAGPNNPRGGSQIGQQRSPSGTVLDLLEKIDPEKAKQLRESQSDLAGIVDSLKSVRDAFEDQGKELARQKIEFIKAKMEALKLLAKVNPEAVAREAAKLAEELEDAVKTYVDAGGNRHAGGGGGFPMAAAAASAPLAATGDGQSDNAAGEEEAPVAAEAETAAGPALGSIPAGQSEAVAAATSVADHLRALAVGNGETERPGTAEVREADQAFIERAKELLKDLEKIVEKAKARLAWETDPEADREVKQAEEALRDTRQALNGLSAGLGSTPIAPTGNVDVLA